MTKRLILKNMSHADLHSRLKLWKSVREYLIREKKTPDQIACICWGIDKHRTYNDSSLPNRKDLKHNYPEMWKYHPHTKRDVSIFWWNQVGLPGRLARIKAVENIIRDVEMEISSRESTD